MEATSSSETSVDFQRITRRYVPEARTHSVLLLVFLLVEKLTIIIKAS
jgi:hypothetical protein